MRDENVDTEPTEPAAIVEAEDTSLSGVCTVDDLDALVSKGITFSTILADPPWPYREGGVRGAAAKHYGTIPLQDIATLPVPQLAQLPLLGPGVRPQRRQCRVTGANEVLAVVPTTLGTLEHHRKRHQ